jgi:hypothetical protein
VPPHPFVLPFVLPHPCGGAAWVVHKGALYCPLLPSVVPFGGCAWVASVLGGGGVGLALPLWVVQVGRPCQKGAFHPPGWACAVCREWHGWQSPRP